MGKNSNIIKPVFSNFNENEFDVRKNLQKLKSGKNYSSYVTEENSGKNREISEYINNKTKGTSFETTDLVGLNDNMHLRYDKLKDDFNLEIKEIKKDYSSFSKEVTEKYLTKSEFWIIISGLITILSVIGIMFYTLSYQDIKESVKELKQIPETEKTEINNQKPSR